MICFVLPSLKGGGAERVSLSLLRGLTKAGHQVALLLLNEGGALRHQIPADVCVISLGHARLRYGVWGLMRALNILQPTVVFSTIGYVNLALLLITCLLKVRPRLVLREANLPSLSLPNSRYPRVMWLSYKKLYRAADLVICTSTRMADEFIDNFHVVPTKIRVLPNPVDEFYIREAAKSIYASGSTAIRFIAVGRLAHQKGLDRLLYWFAELNTSDSELVILGDGPMENQLRRLADQLGLNRRVVFIGFQANPWGNMAAADVLLLPSRWEGMPNVVLEALACGVPVIATPESGGIAEVAAETPPGAIVLAAAGQAFIEAMRKVPCRPKDTLPPSLLPPQYQLESVVDTFVSWLNQID